MHCETEEFRLDPCTKWYSQKKNTSGLTYKIGRAINHDKCLWLRGPFPAGEVTIWFTPSSIISFLSIFFALDYSNAWHYNVSRQSSWIKSLWQGSSSIDHSSSNRKKCIGGSGYAGEPDRFVVSRWEHPTDFKKFMKRVKSRQETFNARLEVFRVLTSWFHYGTSSDNKMKMHQMCVVMITIIVQYSMENGSLLLET